MRLEQNVINTLRTEGFYDSYNDLFISDRVEKEEVEIFKKNLQRLGLGNLFNSQTILVFGKSLKDLHLGDVFEVFFPHEEVEKNIKLEAILKYVNLSKGRKIDYLPKGCTGICLIEFKGEIPKIIDRLKFYNEKFDELRHYNFYLTQKPILDRILELQNEN